MVLIRQDKTIGVFWDLPEPLAMLIMVAIVTHLTVDDLGLLLGEVQESPE